MNTRYREHRTTGISILFPLILLNVIFFFLNNLVTEGGLEPGLALESAACRERHEWWRLGSYMFLHADFTHILFNMWGLWLFGGPLEAVIGWRRFAQLYFLSGILGGLAWLATSSPLGGTCVGASAGVTGVVIATATLYPNAKIMLLLPPIPMTLKTFAIAYMAAELLLGWFKPTGDGVAHAAHLGGGAAGFIYIAIQSFFRPELYPIRDNLQLLWWKATKGYWVRQKLERPPRIEKFPQESIVRPPPPLPKLPPVTTSTTLQENLPGIDTAEVDRLLDKIRLEGQASLTDSERQTLRQARETLRRQGPQ